MKNTNEVSKESAVRMSFGSLSKQNIADVEARVADNNFGKVKLAYYIYKLLLKQSRRSRTVIKNINRKQCRLINIRAGVIFGSGWCEKCDGALGRGDDC